MSSSVDSQAVTSTAAEETPVFEAVASRDELILGCKTSLDFLASIVLTEIYSYGYPALFHGLWQLLCDAAIQLRGKPKYALGIPRGFAKTILMKLYVVWLVLFSDRGFILIVCNTEAHAMNFLSDVAEMLSHPNIISIFGDWRANMGDSDTKALKKFDFRGRSITIAAIGSGSSPRGLNIKFVRPDCVIMDDMQNRDEAENSEIAKEQMIWMLGTLMKACHPQRCVFIFVGNMYPFEGSILRKLKHSAIWTSIITGAILADGESIWPEHRSVEDLLEELANDTEQGHPEIFYAEVMNDEEGGTVSGIDVSKIKHLPDGLMQQMAQGGFIIIDPSGRKKKSDNTAIGAVLVFDETPVLWEVVNKQMDPGETIKTATLLAMKYNMQLIVVEGVAYQETLAYWFEQVWEQLGVEGLNIATITPGGLQKNARIRSWFQLLLSGKNYLHPQVRSEVIYEITQFNPLKTNNVDNLLDIGAYMTKVIAENKNQIALMVMAANENDNVGTSTADMLELAF